ncbi:hypothetical protein CEQ90_13615 [Lewinellaceae bacterium SD302]|nr:hypothetical protein CEQ90_13615 [Lewinellaceae bacterium SD302]
MIKSEIVQLGTMLSKVKYGPYLKAKTEGSVRYLRGQDFSDHDLLINDGKGFVNVENHDSNKDLLEEGQVILAAKGFRNFAWAYSGDAGECIASSMFFVLSVNSNLIDPRYLSIYLNSQKVKRRLLSLGAGTSLPTLPRKELLALEISVPPFLMQQRVIRLRELQKERSKIQQSIQSAEHLLDSAIIENILNQ